MNEPKKAESGGKNATSGKLKLLVIQLGRTGDILQSLMALRAAKQLYPQLDIHLVCRETFAAPAKRVPWLSKVYTLPTDKILGGVQEGQKSQQEALSDLAKWITPFVQEPWDLLMNWTYSEASSWLTGIIPSKVKLGYTRRRDGALSCADGWSHFIQAVVQGGFDQNIHLTDVLTTQLLTALQIHIGDPGDATEAPVTSKAFFSLELRDSELGSQWKDPTRKWVGIQLGTGQVSKAWSGEQWASVAAYILGRHPECRIMLLGSEMDKGRAEDFMRAIEEKGSDRRSITSMVGKTSFDLWASAVGRCQWILACDTAVVQLAGVLGTRVLNVAVGPVRSSETGPYGNGHYVVAPATACTGCTSRDSNRSKHSCYSDITPEAIYASWSYASTEWAHRRQITLESHFTQMGWSKELAAIRVTRTKIRATSEGGGVVYEPMINRPLRISDWNSQVLGHIARAWYCGWTPPIGQELERSNISPSLVKSLRELSESAEVLSKICEEAKRTAGTMHQKSSKLRSDKLMGIQERTEIQELAKKLQDLDELITRLGIAQESLAPFAQMAKVLMHNLRGEAIAELSRETAECYQQLGQGSAILGEWIKKTLGLVRPVAIVSEAKSL